MKTLKELEGSQISVVAPFLGANKVHSLKLHKVEEAGIWIESQDVTEIALGWVKQSAFPGTLLFFLPWHQITLIFGVEENVPSFSVKALGL